MSVQETEAPAPTITQAPLRTLPKVATASATLRDVFIVTWAVPVEKLQGIVPAGVTLERLPNSDGQLVGFVQLVFALRDDARWSPLPALMGDDFHETTLQLLTRTDGERSAFVVAHFVGSTQAAGTLTAFTRVVEEARFHVYIAGDPARQTFARLGIKLTTHAVQVHLRAEACETPERTLIGSWHESVAFLTRFNRQLHLARLSKEALSLFRTEHLPLTPCAARLTHQVVRPFDNLELGEPVLALYQAELPVTSLPIKRK